MKRFSLTQFGASAEQLAELGNLKQPQKLNLGFTGTRDGMTSYQLDRLQVFLELFGVWFIECHHGDCLGSDEQFHELINIFRSRRGAVTYSIHVHPPRNSSLRAFCEADILYPPKDYIPRNHDIVDQTHLLIATPNDDHERQRSGTWATIRYARQTWRDTYIIYPMGDIKHHGKNTFTKLFSQKG